jgi:hypothetical protein
VRGSRSVSRAMLPPRTILTHATGSDAGAIAHGSNRTLYPAYRMPRTLA